MAGFQPPGDSVAAITERLAKLRQQSTSTEKVPEPEDIQPRLIGFTFLVQSMS